MNKKLNNILKIVEIINLIVILVIYVTNLSDEKTSCINIYIIPIIVVNFIIICLTSKWKKNFKTKLIIYCLYIVVTFAVPTYSYERYNDTKNSQFGIGGWWYDVKNCYNIVIDRNIAH